jgi:hypothetical protein
VATAVAAAAPDPDRHFLVLSGVAELAVEQDGWLNAWLDAEPRDAHAWSTHAEALHRLAWRLRGRAPAGEVLPEQLAGFRRVLPQAAAAAERAAALAPDLAAPWIVLAACAPDLSFDHDRFRGIWTEIVARAPLSVPAHHRALAYWQGTAELGTAELAEAFVAETAQRATPGRLLTGVRLEYLFGKEGGDLAWALDAALADLAAAPPDHPYRAHLRHWLAYHLTRAGRYPAAVEQFRAIDGYAGAQPWERYPDAAGAFAGTRAEALAGGQYPGGAGGQRHPGGAAGQQHPGGVSLRPSVGGQ